MHQSCGKADQGINWQLLLRSSRNVGRPAAVAVEVSGAWRRVSQWAPSCNFRRSLDVMRSNGEMLATTSYHMMAVHFFTVNMHQYDTKDGSTWTLFVPCCAHQIACFFHSTTCISTALRGRRNWHKPTAPPLAHRPGVDISFSVWPVGVSDFKHSMSFKVIDFCK